MFSDKIIYRKNEIKLENENSIGFLQLKKISKNDWLKIALIIGILFSIGFGGGDALKRFVQQTDDPLLFGQRLGELDDELLKLRLRNRLSG